MKKPYLLALILLCPIQFLLGQNETLYPWTDTQGRTLQASFISFDAAAQIVTIKLTNGVIYPAPLSSLSNPSQALAKQLGAPPPPPAPPPAAASPFDAILAEVTQEMVGPEALDIEHEWKSADGRALQAKFVSLEGDQLTLIMKTKQFTIGLNNFAAESQTLAKMLQSVAAKHRPAGLDPTPLPAKVTASAPSSPPPAPVPTAPVATPKPVAPPPAVPAKPVAALPLPKVTEADLEKSHTWKNSSGNPLEASFVAADEKAITLKLPRRLSPYILPWNKLSPESVALGKALQKLKKSLVPSILPGNERTLARYGSGKWKNYNTIIESVAFEGGISAIRSYDKEYPRHLMFPLDLWFVKDGVRMEETKMTMTMQPFAMAKRFDEKGKPIMRDGKQEWSFHRRWLKSVSSPEVSNDRRKTSIEGVLDNGSKFEFNYELSQSGVSVWGEVKDSPKEDFPTHMRMFIWSTSLASTAEAAQMTAPQIKETAGDGMFYLDLVKGRKLKFPFSDQFVTIKKKLRDESKGEDISIVKTVEYKGSPFGDHRAKLEHKAKKNILRWDEGYGAKFALQGIRMELIPMESEEAKRDKENQKKYKGIGEIGYSDRVQVKIYRGD